VPLNRRKASVYRDPSSPWPKSSVFYSSFKSAPFRRYIRPSHS